MLKKFFISMLGTMAGLWISLALLVIIGTVSIGTLIGKYSNQETGIEKKSILYIKLSGTVDDRCQPSSLINIFQEMEDKAPTLNDMTRSLRLAAKDDRIVGLFLECGGSNMGTASREELLEAIGTFKDSGKWVYAYGDNYTQGDYLIATAADGLDMNHVGAVELHGVGGMVPFYKGLLDKLGIKMQILKVGTYKSAVEPYILDKMSEPARQQMQQYCDTIWNFISQTIAANRDMPEAQVRRLASEMIFTRPSAEFVGNLVDTLVYRREVDGFLADMSGLESDDDPRLITPKEYLKDKEALDVLKSGKRHIAVLYALGEISDSGSEGIVGNRIVKEITELADDDNIEGLVLRVNSPGGSAFASEQIWSALEYFKSQDEPFYVSMGDYAASGGYYISCGADSIFADRTTITGSIGVFGMIPDFSGLATGKLGLTFNTVETNPNGIGVNVLEPMTPQQRNAMQQSVENIYDLFTSRVAQGRGMSQDSVKAIAEGRVWVGSDAIRLGLVDRIGSLETAVCAMADKLGLDPTDTESYPKFENSFWEQMILENVDLNDIKAAGYDAETMRYIRTVRKLRDANPLQARMPEVYIK